MAKREDKPEIIRAEVMGFCMGVKKALSRALKLAEEQGDSPIYTLGPLIHNPVALKYLEERGIRELKEDAPGRGFLIIRAHGIPPAEREKYASLGYTLVDATCPRVLKSQRIVKEYSRKGYFIVLVGDKEHSEIVGIKGYARDCTVISSRWEAEKLSLPEKCLVLAQTTYSQEEYKEIITILKTKNPECIIQQSICPATEKRQESLSKLLEVTEAVVVVGGKNSANTTRLYKRAVAAGKPAWHIESAEELPADLADYKRIGITAGASTPDWTIKEVETRILEEAFMANILSEIEKRRAKRALDTREIPSDVLDRIINAAVLAPSCANKQPWRFVVVSKEPELSKVKEHLSGGNYWGKKSPTIILVATKRDLDCQLDDSRDYALFDTGLSVMNLLLQATREGLIAHPIAGFEPVPLKKTFGIPEEYILITLVILGYPGDESYLNDKHREQEHEPRKRKPLGEAVNFNSWGF